MDFNPRGRAVKVRCLSPRLHPREGKVEVSPVRYRWPATDGRPWAVACHPPAGAALVPARARTGAGLFVPDDPPHGPAPTGPPCAPCAPCALATGR
jgi:hypothetical protein